tara:strand:- start:2693 stop:2875 length:183 start_codon:yes stop_codon:yes gene_type:complete
MKINANRYLTTVIQCRNIALSTTNKAHNMKSIINFIEKNQEAALVIVVVLTLVIATGAAK